MLKYLNHVIAVSAVVLLSIAITNMVMVGNCKDDNKCKIDTNDKFLTWYGIVGTIFGLSLISKLLG